MASGSPPNETGLSWKAFSRDYNADRLGFLTTLTTRGPVVRMTANLVFTADPVLVERVFRDSNTDFQMVLNRRLERVPAGRGEAELDTWMRTRRRAVSVLHRMASRPDPLWQDSLRGQVDRWLSSTGPFDPLGDLTRLNLRTSVALVVGTADPRLEAETLALLEQVIAVVDNGVRLPGVLALLSRRHRRARHLDAALRRRPHDLATGPTPSDGLLSGLHEPETDPENDPEPAVNLAVAVLLAGTLVPSAAGAWVLSLLAAHPGWQTRARTDPVARTWVINEALRLYPPTWLISRTVARDGVYEGWQLQAGDEIVMSPYISQRSARAFPEPERFAPERWESARPGLADYFPFGAGARRCLGAGLALSRLDHLVGEVLARTSRLQGEVPASASTTSTLTPVDARVRFTG